MPPAIHQLVAGFNHGDAISNEARLIRGIARGWGHSSEIACEHDRTLPELRRDTVDLAALPGILKPDDVVILHLSIGSAVNVVFPNLRARRVIVYHNITPSEHFQALSPGIAHVLARGREQARALAGSAELNLAVSAYNAGELAAWGYRDPKVLPLLLDLDGLDGPEHRGVLDRYADGLTNVLFVGRGAPNKRLEDLLHAFYFYQTRVNPDSRLIHVGSFAGMESYLALLYTRQKELGLENVDFVGSMPDDQLRACYASARLFLCMSEHEGFCIPLLEAMSRGIPVLAHAAAAVPETMDGAGVLFAEKRFDLVAEMMGRLTAEGPFRAAVLQGQRERVARYRARDLAAELRAHLAPLLSSS